MDIVCLPLMLVVLGIASFAASRLPKPNRSQR